ncbi:DUF3789 domain-containing protein [Erysipelothrix urinaevulpis]|nr:DUF3789 domain-containing protein [Erysipelothrix urinaevulpis]
MIKFIAGMVVGSIVGIMIMAIVIVGSRYDE